jgi:hypothetical protein
VCIFDKDIQVSMMKVHCMHVPHVSVAIHQEINIKHYNSRLVV